MAEGRFNRLVLVRVIIAILICGAGLFAQSNSKKAKPDFSGVWILDESRSENLEDRLFKTKPPVPSQRVKRKTTLAIVHNGPEFKTTEIITVNEFDEAGKLLKETEGKPSTNVFYTDKRGEKNPYSKDKYFESSTKWDGKSVVVLTTIDKEKRQFAATRSSLSKDGMELTIVTTMVVIKYDPTTMNDYFVQLPFGSTKVYRKSN